MKLDEIFEKYPNETEGFYRKANLEKLKKQCPDASEETILKVMSKYPVVWLKGLKGWGNQESRNMGYGIPQFMIDDANADDWELYQGASSPGVIPMKKVTLEEFKKNYPDVLRET